jgi:hypothetical protein
MIDLKNSKGEHATKSELTTSKKSTTSISFKHTNRLSHPSFNQKYFSNSYPIPTQQTTSSKKKHQSPISHRAMTRQAHRSNKE